jgi:ubiquinone/menaquinone biosynthesis C-methylase UbiE
MSQLSNMNPTGRFSNVAERYSRCRPSYPDEAIDYILARCALKPGGKVADIGSGTGISSRLLAARGLQVFGIEPNAEMRRQAESHPSTSKGLAPIYREGKAEATGLFAGEMDAVIAAQAFHWFDPAATLPEFRRILKPCGRVILMWYEIDTHDPFSASYSSLLHSTPEGAAVLAARTRGGSVLLQSPLFTDGERRNFINAQDLKEEELLGRAFSASYAPKEQQAAAKLTADMRDLFESHQRNGQVRLCYETSVYTARPIAAAIVV